MHLNTPEAQSMSNGILFYSKRHKGYYAVATIDDNDNIKTQWTNEEFKPKIPIIERHMTALLISICIAVLLIILLAFQGWIYAIRGILFFYIFFRITISIMFIVDGSKGDSFKFHSAEHMILNAYHKLKRVPSLEELRDFSRFDNTCGTNSQFITLINSTILLIITFTINNPLCCIILFLFNFAISVVSLCGGLNFLQLLTTRTSTDRELLVAIAGLKTRLEHEQNY